MADHDLADVSTPALLIELERRTLPRGHPDAIPEAGEDRPAGDGAMVAERQPAVWAALDHLEDRTERLDHLVAQLIDRLRPVRSMRDGGTPVAPERDGVAHLPARIGGTCAKLDELGDAVADVLGELEL